MSNNYPEPAGSAPIPRFSLSLDYSDLQFASMEIKAARDKDIDLFEEEFAQYIGAKRAFYVGSARMGMYYVLQALNLPPKSKILMPAWTHPSMPCMVVAQGHRPRIADVTEGTWTMGPDDLTKIDWSGIGAIVTTHMFGTPAKAWELSEMGRYRNIPVIEDCAQGLGATIDGKKTGTFSDVSLYSLSLTKNLTTLTGGMIAVNDQALADKLETIMSLAPSASNNSFIPHLAKAFAVKTATTPLGFRLGVNPMLSIGWSFSGRDMLHPTFEESFTTMPPGDIYKPSAAQASLGRRMLKKLDEHNAKRRENGKILLQYLQEKKIPYLGLPTIVDHGEQIFMTFVITWPKRDRMARYLFSKGVDTSPGYLCPVNQVLCISDQVECLTPIPNAHRLCNEQLHLPIYPGLTREQLKHIADSVAWATTCASPDPGYDPRQYVKEAHKEFHSKDTESMLTI